MKRLTISAVLLAALTLPAIAGDIPGSGKQDPGPVPTPSPTSTTTTPTTTSSSLASTLLTIYLAIIGV